MATRTRATGSNPVGTAVVLVLAAVLLVELPAGNDPHFPWKYLALLLGTGAALALATGQLLARRARARISVPAALLAAFLAALLVRGVLADVPFEAALVGSLYRYDGLLLYLAGAVLLVLAWQFLDPWTLLRALVGIAAFVAAWALLTAPSGDPLLNSYATAERTALESTLGNANFLAAFLGLSVGPCLAVALRHRDVWRWVALGALIAIAVVLPLTRSLQAVPVLAVSAGVVLLIWGENGDSRRRNVVRTAAAAVAAAALLAGVAVTAGVGPGAGVRASEIGTVQARLFYWAAATEIVQDHPLAGIGPGQFRGAYTPYRSVEAAVTRPFDAIDAPHNVVLKLAAENGLVLAALYLAFVASVGWILLRGLISLRGEQRLALAGVGAAWLAYQAQSLVSIEVVPLAVVHYVTAGAVLSASGAAPFALRPGASRRGEKKGRVAAVTVAAMLVVVLPLLLRPVRADVAVGSGVRAVGAGAAAEARAAFDRARRLAPYEPEYVFLAGRAFEQRQDAATALGYYAAAASLEPGNARYQLGATRTAAALQDAKRTLTYAEALLASDPHNPELLAKVTQLRLSTGHLDPAAASAARLVEVRPQSPAAWVLAGQVAAAARRPGEARQAFETALRLDPGSTEARDALRALHSGTAES
jgi:putative inorganic carbon (HCO3(-)) transporter